MKMATRWSATVVLVAALAACHGAGLLQVIKDLSIVPTVCAAGYFWGPSGNTACYFTITTASRRKIEMTQLPCGPGRGDACACAIACSDADVYTAGYYTVTTYATSYVACYWKNDVKIDLPGGVPPKGARALSIFISGQTIHVAGQYYDGTKCVAEEPALREITPNHFARCHYAGQLNFIPPKRPS